MDVVPNSYKSISKMQFSILRLYCAKNTQGTPLIYTARDMREPQLRLKTIA